MKVMSDKRVIFVFIFPALFIFFTMVIIPIFTSVYYSLNEWDGIAKLNMDSFVGLKNYFNLLISNNDKFYKAIINSLILALLSIIIQLPIAFLLATLLATGVKGEGFYRSVYFIPVIVSTVVIGQMWIKIYNPQYGLLNGLLTKIGLEALTQEWLGNPKTALASVFVPLIWQYIGYHMLLFYAAIKSVSKDILEAAKIDGANFWQETFHIIMPNIIHIIEVCVILALIGSLKTFDLIYILTNGGPLHATEVPSTMMFGTIFHRMNYGYGSSMAVFIVIECLVITVFIKALFKRLNTLD